MELLYEIQHGVEERSIVLGEVDDLRDVVVARDIDQIGIDKGLL
jgi:hypothetical protein